MGIATLHLTNAYHPHSGGIRTMYDALLAQAEREGRRMSLVVPAGEDGETRVGRTTTIYSVRAPRAPGFDRRYRTILPHRFLRPGAGRLWSILDRERPDLVEVCDKYSLCYLAGIIRKRRQHRADGPTLVGLSCERLDDNLQAHLSVHPAMRRAARAFLGRVYIGMFDAHIANSAYTAEELRDAMTLPHVRPVYVGLMGVHTPERMPPPWREHLRQRVRADLAIPDDVRLVLYAGRLSPEKYVGALTNVAASLARSGGARLIVAGDGPLRETIERECGVVAPGIARFLGQFDARALSDVLAACDVFVHPNPREPFGIGPLEVMAVSVPLVAPRAGGILSYANDDNAWLTGPGGDALAAGVQLALGNDDERARRAAAARLTAERFHWKGSAARMLRRYDRIHWQRLTASPDWRYSLALSGAVTGRVQQADPPPA